jgi:uroporphyrinogen-III synthase
MVQPLGLATVVQPAFTYLRQDAQRMQPEVYEELKAGKPADLLLFTSPRSVQHGLPQIPPELLRTLRIAAIGPATAQALSDAGVRVNVTPRSGFTSEDLLAKLETERSAGPGEGPGAFILAAPGGRTKLSEGLQQLGWSVRTVQVYKSEPETLDKQALAKLENSSGVLSVWTSGNTIKALSQRLPPAVWFRLCQGEWLVISERLRRLARAYRPSAIHLAPGPGNPSIFTAIRSLIR